MARTLIIQKIHERVDTTVDVRKTGKIKQQTRWIAKASNTPFITSIFGELINPYCHIRADLN